MKKLNNLLIFILLALIPNQLFAAPAPNMAPIIMYLLSDSTSTSSIFTKGTPSYYINERGLKGDRTLSSTDSTYAGFYYDPDGTQYPDSGHYVILNDILTLTQDGSGYIFVIEYVSPTEYGDGKTFSVSSTTINNGIPFESYSYDSDAERTNGITLATAFMHDFFINSRKYYLDETDSIGERDLHFDNGTLPYTGNYNGILDGTFDTNGTNVDGTYFIFADTMVLTRSDNTEVVIKHTGDTNLSVNDFNVSINGAAPVGTTNYKFQSDRDAAYFPTDLGFITTDEFTALIQPNSINIVNTWWYIDDATNIEQNVIESNGSISITQYINNVAQAPETLYYTNESNATLGNYIGIQDTLNGPTLETLKFYKELTKLELEGLFPHITFSTGAAAIKVAGISVGESFDPWSEAGDSNTVTYTNFTNLITGMIYGNTSSGDDGYITGNGSNSLVFATGSTTTDGTIVVASNNQPAGSYTIRDVAGVSTLVVTITDPDFMEWSDHIAFQYMNPGTGTAMYRGDIRQHWSDIWLNTIGKDDVLTFLSAP